MTSNANDPLAPKAPAPNRGPMEQVMAAQWDRIWNAQRTGEVWEFFKNSADAMLDKFRAGAPNFTPEQTADLEAAERLHAAHSAHLTSHLDHLKMIRSYCQWAFEAIFKGSLDVGQHVLRSLTLSNGAVVLGTIAFIGNVHSPELQSALIPVLVLCGAGFLLSLAGGHALVWRAGKVMPVLVELTVPRMSEISLKQKNETLQSHVRKIRWIVQPFFYLSAACLIAALWVGVQALRADGDMKGPFPDVLVE